MVWDLPAYFSSFLYHQDPSYDFYSIIRNSAESLKPTPFSCTCAAAMPHSSFWHILLHLEMTAHPLKLSSRVTASKMSP